MNIALNEGYKELRPGDAQLLRVKAVSYDEDKGRMRVTFADAEGGASSEFYNLFTKRRVKGQRGLQTVPNDGALTAFSTMAKHALGDWSREEVDPDELVGCYLVANVRYDRVKNEETGEVREYLHVRGFQEADGRTFDDEAFDDGDEGFDDEDDAFA